MKIKLYKLVIIELKSKYLIHSFEEVINVLL